MVRVYDYYRSTIEENSRFVRFLKRRIYVVGIARLLLVIGLIINLAAGSGQSWQLLVAIALVYTIPFIILMTYHNRLFGRKSRAEALILLCERELKGLDYDFSAFDGASDKSDPHHSFSLDLDLFGEQSFFQSVNRTVTHGGREILAEWFLKPLSGKAAILERQDAVRELSGFSRLRQDFYVEGILHQRNKKDVSILSALVGTSVRFANNRIWNVLTWLVPVSWLVVLVAYMFHAIGDIVPLSYLWICVFLSNSKIKQINALHRSVNKMEKIFSTYSRLMEMVEKTAFTSEVLAGIQNRLISNGGKASQAIRQLSSRLGALDQRANMVMGIINIFTLRDIRIAIRLEQWKRTYSADIGNWFEALAHFDALASLSGFAFNHPGYIYPQIADHYFSISGKSLGHPLLHRDICVKNDIVIERNPSFMIVTGANMAGKSTYLRTVGINFVLACIGAPVCADELAVYPAGLVTSLRTSDSLTNNESYFYAELKRLKMIIDRLKAGEELFIILDEILKGTNSTDKQKGSLALVKQFISDRTCGIIATHDLVLGTLQDEFPQYIKNFHFDADITEDKLSFSFRLREGIAQNMNACFLMHKMGMTV